jgi:hypothetical protein
VNELINDLDDRMFFAHEFNQRDDIALVTLRQNPVTRRGGAFHSHRSTIGGNIVEMTQSKFIGTKYQKRSVNIRESQPFCSAVKLKV